MGQLNMDNFVDNYALWDVSWHTPWQRPEITY